MEITLYKEIPKSTLIKDVMTREEYQLVNSDSSDFVYGVVKVSIEYNDKVLMGKYPKWFYRITKWLMRLHVKKLFEEYILSDIVDVNREQIRLSLYLVNYYSTLHKEHFNIPLTVEANDQGDYFTFFSDSSFFEKYKGDFLV